MKFYKIEITTLEPIVIGYDSSNESRDIISGTALRGLFIKENIKNSSDIAKLILSKNIIFTDAYLKKDNDYFIPTPKSFLCDKHDMKELKRDKEKSIDIKNCLFSPDEKFENKTMTEGIGSRFVNLSDDSLKTAKVNKVENMHINKSIKEGTASLYRYEAIDKGQTFYSLAILKDNEVISEENLKKIKGTKYIGKSRSATYGKVDIKVENLENLDNFKKDLKLKSIIDDRKTLDIYFLTDTILKDQYGNTCSILPNEEIEKMFGLKKVEIADGQFVTNKIIGGYNSHQKIALPKDTAIEAGSIIRYKIIDGVLTEEKIKDIEKKGIGYFRERGFGRVIINPNFEQSKVIKWTETEDKNQEEDKSGIPKPIPKIIDTDEETMYKLLKLSIETDKERANVEKLIVSEEFLNKQIKVSIKEKNQINQLIDLLNTDEINIDGLGLKKDEVYNDRNKISIFNDSVNLFINNIKSKNIEKYIGECGQKVDKLSLTLEEKMEFIKRLVREGLYFQTRRER